MGAQGTLHRTADSASASGKRTPCRACARPARTARRAARTLAGGHPAQAGGHLFQILGHRGRRERAVAGRLDE